MLFEYHFNPDLFLVLSHEIIFMELLVEISKIREPVCSSLYWLLRVFLVRLV